MQKELHFFRDNFRWLAGGFLLLMFSSFGQSFFIGLAGNELRAKFNLSGGAFGLIYMIATLASAAVLPWLGRSLDLMPSWKVTRFVMPLLALACLLLAFAPHVAVLVVAIFLLRLFGQGMMTEIAYTDVGRWFVASRGLAMAMVTPGLQAGTALLPIAYALISASLGWQATWAASAAFLVLACPGLLALTRVERVPHARESLVAGRTARDWSRSEVARDPMLYLLLAGTLAPPFIGTTIFFHQGYFIELRGYDPISFAAAFPVMAVSTIVFGFVCGHLVDRFGAIRLLPWFLVPLAVASATAALITPLWGIYVFMFLLGISNGFTSTLLGALWPEVYGVANLGGIRAMTVSAMVLATALGPGLTGILIDLGVDLPEQLLWMSGWCLLSSLLLAYAAKAIARREYPHVSD
ncbi:MFS transporter [Sphingobium fuliginis]|uniref:MFS transporter n=1 Tax=Sphingobium fuliginis (strain ATCC 27551) TaxID=336203 RepID=UPI001C3FC7FE|nr:MFS transporter [Sphingobium fuliginis]